MNLEEQRISLIMELRREGIVDTSVLSALERVPRERFVPPALINQAYENAALPLSQGQTISQPFVVAYMTEALQVGERMKVLEVGTGSGYQAAVLAALCRRVYTVERHRALLKEAEARFQDLGLHNITTRLGDGGKGWPEQAPFERILVTAAAETVPETLCMQLGDGGILVAPVGGRASQEIWRVRRQGDALESERLLPVRFVPLVEGLPE
ncbi:MAG: protein-L-isoaspartate(D-aspartate) O-methyltransferase [Alphaproteobacteria bacterium]|nr:protein-L-isoaspartate(D-aspartate) O-methyltransferase [Alphaproteobacteria bacterium]